MIRFQLIGTFRGCHDRPPRGRHQRGPRRGTAIIVVLGVISITLAMSYAILRSQATALQIQANSRHRGDARLAAMTGIKIALRKMHQSDWTGVGTAISGNISDRERYEASFETGDPSLAATDSEYWRYPYRVTINATGFSSNPVSNVTSTHRMRAVVQLTPRQLSSEPNDWTLAEPYTVYQWTSKGNEVQLPVHIEGPVHFEGPLELCENYPIENNRPFDGTIRNVAVFQTALIPADVEAIYNAMIFNVLGDSTTYGFYNPMAWWVLDESPGATVAVDQVGVNNGLYVGPSPTSLFGWINVARFDGYNDYVNLGAVDVSGTDLTILAWFFADSFSRQPNARIISKATGNSHAETYWMLGVVADGDATRLQFQLKTGGVTSSLIGSSAAVLTGRAVFAAAVYDGTEMKLYLDGELVGSTSVTGTIDTDATAEVFIGDNPPGSPRTRYLRDLEAAHVAGEADYRPLSGPVYLDTDANDELTLSLLQDDLGAAPTEHVTASRVPASHPGAVTDYQLYPGGLFYSVVRIATGALANQTLEPDVLTNPLGVFYRNGTLSLGDNTTVRGTIISKDKHDVYFLGGNLKIDPVLLPEIGGLAATVQLPVVISGDDIHADDNVQGEINGLLFARRKFWQRDELGENRFLTITGKVLADEIKLLGRDSWKLDADTWQSRLSQFTSQSAAGLLSGVLAYFPGWLEDGHQQWIQPVLTIRPESAPVSYHWQDWSQPLFVPHPDDPGLRWDLLEWTDVD